MRASGTVSPMVISLVIFKLWPHRFKDSGAKIYCLWSSVLGNPRKKYKMSVKEECRAIASIWRENMLRYLSADIICSEKRTARKTASFEEQIMSKDKYLSIFLKPNGGYCGYYPSNIFRNM